MKSEDLKLIVKEKFDDNSFDAVISNCVLNLVPDKSKAFNLS